MSVTTASPELTERVVKALGSTLQETHIIGTLAYAMVPDPLAFKQKMEDVERELDVDIHCTVHVEQQHASLFATPRT